MIHDYHRETVQSVLNLLLYENVCKTENDLYTLCFKLSVIQCDREHETGQLKDILVFHQP